MRQIVKFAVPDEHAEEWHRIYRKNVGNHHGTDCVLRKAQLRQQYRKGGDVAAIDFRSDDAKLNGKEGD